MLGSRDIGNEMEQRNVFRLLFYVTRDKKDKYEGFPKVGEYFVRF